MAHPKKIAYLKYRSFKLDSKNVFRNLYLGVMRTGFHGTHPHEAYLKAFSKECGWDFESVYYTTSEDIAAIFDDPSYGLYAITAYVDAQIAAQTICRIAGKKSKQLIIGGFLMSLAGEVGRALREDLFRINPDIYIVYGAGTGGQFLMNILKGINKKPDEIQGIIWYDGENEHWNRSDSILDSDKCYDIVNKYNFLIRSRHPHYEPPDMALFLQSGGCIYGKCTFCSRKAYCLGKTSDEKALEIIQKSIDKGIRTFQTLEEDVLGFKNMLKELPARFAKYKICLDSQMAPSAILRNKDLIEYLLDSGIRLRIKCGIEHSVDRILTYFNKGTTSDEMYKCVEYLGELSKKFPDLVYTEIFLIDLVPNITIDEFWQHLNFLFFAYSNNVSIFDTRALSRLYYFPGSELYKTNYFDKGDRPLEWFIRPLLKETALEKVYGQPDFVKNLAMQVLRKYMGYTPLKQTELHLKRTYRNAVRELGPSPDTAYFPGKKTII